MEPEIGAAGPIAALLRVHRPPGSRQFPTPRRRLITRNYGTTCPAWTTSAIWGIWEIWGIWAISRPRGWPTWTRRRPSRPPSCRHPIPIQPIMYRTIRCINRANFRHRRPASTCIPPRMRSMYFRARPSPRIIISTARLNTRRLTVSGCSRLFGWWLLSGDPSDFPSSPILLIYSRFFWMTTQALWFDAPSLRKHLACTPDWVSINMLIEKRCLFPSRSRSFGNFSKWLIIRAATANKFERLSFGSFWPSTRRWIDHLWYRFPLILVAHRKHVIRVPLLSLPTNFLRIEKNRSLTQLPHMLP